tara:strand:+ start:1602 stop:2276 length:675 start_codon:yes stop_codon:yes gene_type:complete
MEGDFILFILIATILSVLGAFILIGRYISEGTSKRIAFITAAIGFGLLLLPTLADIFDWDKYRPADCLEINLQPDTKTCNKIPKESFRAISDHSRKAYLVITLSLVGLGVPLLQQLFRERVLSLRKAPFLYYSLEYGLGSLLIFLIIIASSLPRISLPMAAAAVFILSLPLHALILLRFFDPLPTKRLTMITVSFIETWLLMVLFYTSALVAAISVMTLGSYRF